MRVLSPSELHAWIAADGDGFHARLSETDLRVRGVSTVAEYVCRARAACAVDPSASDRARLARVVRRVSSAMSAFECVWVIGIVQGTAYEGGLPHTRGHVIVLPIRLLRAPVQQLMSILVHEQVHVQQKMDPVGTWRYLRHIGFTRRPGRIAGSRANPDLDAYVYTMPDGHVMGSRYVEGATSIGDVEFFPINRDEFESPLEWMAYRIARSKFLYSHVYKK